MNELQRIKEQLKDQIQININLLSTCSTLGKNVEKLNHIALAFDKRIKDLEYQLDISQDPPGPIGSEEHFRRTGESR